MRSVYLVCLALLLAPAAHAANAITKETLKIDRESRTYYMFAPDTLGSEPAPLVIALHGSGRDATPGARTAPVCAAQAADRDVARHQRQSHPVKSNVLAEDPRYQIYSYTK